MIGLILGFVVLGYVALLAGATYLGFRWAKRNSEAGRFAWLGAIVGFLIVLLPVFWDALPTLVAHRWYCETEAGLHVYKSVDQWKRDNPGIAGDVKPASGRPRITKRDGVVTYPLNSRFRAETRSEPRAWGIRMRDERIVDDKTQEVLAKWLDFNTAPGNIPVRGIQSFRDVKFWMHHNYCHQSREASGLSRFAAIQEQFQALGDAK